MHFDNGFLVDLGLQLTAVAIAQALDTIQADRLARAEAADRGGLQAVRGMQYRPAGSTGTPPPNWGHLGTIGDNWGQLGTFGP